MTSKTLVEGDAVIGIASGQGRGDAISPLVSNETFCNKGAEKQAMASSAIGSIEGISDEWAAV